ncbi:MAG TPA: SH3 domain-containing protein [Thermoanaerobaculia bacterium]
MTGARLVGCSIIAGLARSAASIAETAYTIKSTNLRAGPGRDYPVVQRLSAGRPVEVAGCLDDYAWCDVIAGDDRGWVYSGNLEYPYEGHRVVILNEGPEIGLPIVPFAVGPYWDTYYRTRPWYGRRSYWAARPLPTRRVWVRPSGPRPGGRPPVVRPGRVPDSRVRPAPRPVAPRPVVQPRHEERRRPETRPVERQAPVRPNRPQEKHGDKKH